LELVNMGYASLYAQTAKKRPSTMAQGKTLDRGKGLSIGTEGKEKALFQELFNEAQEAISRVYLPGTMAHIRERERQIVSSIRFAEERINELWLAMRDGETTLDGSRQALTTWKEFHLRAIELYRGPGQGNLF
jgi:hypothetical protein